MSPARTSHRVPSATVLRPVLNNGGAHSLTTTWSGPAQPNINYYFSTAPAGPFSLAETKPFSVQPITNIAPGFYIYVTVADSSAHDQSAPSNVVLLT
jgi:hypothetical protein